MRCTPSAYGSRREVALFVPGTGGEPDEAFSCNWSRARAMVADHIGLAAGDQTFRESHAC